MWWLGICGAGGTHQTPKDHKAPEQPQLGAWHGARCLGTALGLQGWNGTSFSTTPVPHFCQPLFPLRAPAGGFHCTHAQQREFQWVRSPGFQEQGKGCNGLKLPGFPRACSEILLSWEAPCHHCQSCRATQPLEVARELHNHPSLPCPLALGDCIAHCPAPSSLFALPACGMWAGRGRGLQQGLASPAVPCCHPQAPGPAGQGVSAAL